MKKEKYFVLEWTSADITKFLQTAAIDQAVFNFDKSPGKYKLSVASFDIFGALKETYSLIPLSKDKDLDNVYPAGLFFLGAAYIRQYSSNGSNPLYFKPVADASLLYVCYEIFDTAAVDDEFDPNLLITTLKPSPPYGK